MKKPDSRLASLAAVFTATQWTAYHDGKVAFRRGKTEQDNPHRDNFLRVPWLYGWHEARENPPPPPPLPTNLVNTKRVIRLRRR